MTNKNIQMKKREGNDWDNLFPISTFENIFNEKNGENLNDTFDDVSDELLNLNNSKVDKTSLSINVREYEESSIGFQQAIDDATVLNRSVYVPSGAYSLANIEITTSLIVESGVTFKYNGTPGGRLFEITEDYVSINELNIDGENQGFDSITVRSDHVSIMTIDIRNIMVDSSTTSIVYGLILFGDNFYSNKVKTKDFINNGYANESFPQSILNRANNNYFGTMIFENVRSGLVTTLESKTFVNDLIAINIKDNGIYHLGDSTVFVNNMVYDGSEEPAVFHGKSAFVNSFTVRGFGSAIGFQNVEKVRINNLHFESDENKRTALALFRTRYGNTRSGNISIGSISGEFYNDRQDSQLLNVSVGTIEYLTIENIDLDVYYGRASATLSQWANFSGCEGVSLSNIKLRVYDTGNTLTSSDEFYLRVKSNLKYQSYADGIYVSIFKSDRVTPSSAIFRGGDFVQEKINTTNVVYQTNITPQIRETNYGVVNSANTNPQGVSSKYWKKGTFLTNNNVSETGAIGWICTQGGTNSVWREIT